MAFVNYNNKEITTKIVYYGPALSGKTTCLKFIYDCDQVSSKGKLITLDTEGDRTLFFDFLPVQFGKLNNFDLKIQLYTVPGQVVYNTTRRLVLQGADGIVFVADSQIIMRDKNLESIDDLRRNLTLNNLDFNQIPMIFQYNKRDLKEILPLDNLNKELNSDNRPFFPTIALSGENVLEGLHTIIKLVVVSLKNRISIFQKDKTVLFSKEEVTLDQKKKEEQIEKKTPQSVNVFKEKSQQDTQEEDVFELSQPIPVDDLKVEEREEEIFALSSSDEIDDYQVPEIEIPEAYFENSQRATAPSEVFIEPEKEKQPTVAGTGVREIPVEIDVEGNESVIELKIKLKIRKKK